MDKSQEVVSSPYKLRRDEILDLYEQAIKILNDADCSMLGEILAIFAELVEAAVRERCAKVCEETTIAWAGQAYNNGCTDCAQRIRTLT